MGYFSTKLYLNSTYNISLGYNVTDITSNTEKETFKIPFHRDRAESASKKKYIFSKNVSH